MIAKLPFNFNTPSTTYLFSAYPFGILWGGDYFLETLSNYHINISFPNNKSVKPEAKVLYSPKIELTDWDAFGLLTCENIVLSSTPDQNDEIRHLAIHQISNGAYVWARLDEFFLPHSIHYNRAHLSHEILVIGLDGDSQHFCCACYDRNGSFGPVNVSIDDFQAAIKSPYISTSEMMAIRIRDDIIKGGLNRELILTQFRDFISSRESVQLPWKPGTTDFRERSFGLTSYDEAIKYFTLSLENGTAFDLRASRMIWEHQKLMSARILLLEKKGKVPRGLYNSSQLYTLEGVAKRLHLTLFAWLQEREASTKQLITKYIEMLKEANGRLATRLIEHYF